MNFAIIDVETTGGKFNEEGITEVAIHRYDGVAIVDSFITLVNPEKEIQPFVVNLTGINNKMLRNAPKFFEIAKRIIEITENCVLVAHNSSFDYRVIKNEFNRLGYPYDTPTLCTVELSKKLLPEQESYSLGKLCRAIGIPVSDRHRANGDALATLKLFEILLQKDSEKHIVQNTIKVGNQRDLSGRLLKILDLLPPQSGLYYFHRYNGDIIYIGKGKNIKQAVNQVFLRTSNRTRAILKEMDSVTFDLTGSELIAKIKFQEEVTRIRPKHNNSKKRFDSEIQFHHENMILVDKGRSPEEKSVVLIENNQYKGFAYADLSHQISNLNILKRLINSSESYTAQNLIIKKHLDANRVEKIIRF
jgi:DNA polymerase-3 subunit epsilon